ncbi:MAG: hypothetical protein R3D58_12650 [Saprospiraceae bacterium]|jgi:hypothetical protein|nr:hypothetical protein [Lewinellaceae bacterium]
MKHRHLFLVFMLFSAIAYSQTAADVLKFSYLKPGGTARFIGAGSAFGALGAEFGTLSQNPAGLAMYRTDELMLTPSLRFSNTDATIATGSNPTLDESKSHFHFDNIGIVFNTTPRKGNWTTFNVGLGYNQLANYNQGIYYSGNADGTILNNWFADAQQVLNGGGTTDDLDPFTSGLAYEANALYYLNNAFTYDFDGNPNANIEHSQTLTQSGTMNEMVISFAGNYQEKLMIGATVGVPFVRYRLSGEYREADPGAAVDFFDDLAYTEDLSTDGIGVNVKFGVIYRASQAVRLGASFHSPTWLSLTDDYSNTLNYAFTDNSGSYNEQAISPGGNFDYKLATPWRAAVSAAFLIQKAGFLSAEVEWVDYSANKYNFTADIANTGNQLAEREINNEVQRLFEPKMNIRLGGEAALDNFRLRAGVNLLGKPYATETGFNTVYSAGAGVRGESFYLDLAYRFSTGEGSVLPYAGGPLVNTDNRVSDILLTIGFKF